MPAKKQRNQQGTTRRRQTVHEREFRVNPIDRGSTCLVDRRGAGSPPPFIGSGTEFAREIGKKGKANKRERATSPRSFSSAREKRAGLSWDTT